jgi:DNA mismatch repair protein MutL
MAIHRLPPLLVNQIAAGEVIERPASAVKELLENAFDAGATRVAVEIENGGRDLIRVTDDGCGIEFDDLELAVAAHATSKIAAAEDLDAIATLGFRGEALASLAAVSRLNLLSRPRAASEAGLIEVEGGAAGQPRPASGPCGTTLTVRNLFFNTPARRKFLRSDATEAARVVEAVETLALAHPALAFELTVDGRRRVSLPAGQSPAERVGAVLGRELAQELIPLEAEAAGIRALGMVGRPDLARATARQLRVYLNGRFISDRTVNHAVREAYRGLVAPGLHPLVVLMLQIDPTLVDVNVHPAKAEVRFRQQHVVHQAVWSMVRDALAGADLVATVDLARAGGHGASGWRSGGGIGPPGPAARPMAGFDVQAVAPFIETLAAGGPAAPPATVGPAVLVIANRYIVVQEGDGLVIADQHALHERVMFERLKERLGGGSLPRQRLLMPAIVETDGPGALALDGLRPLLERLGIEAELIGPRSIAVHTFTSLLFERRVDPIEFVRDLLDGAERLTQAADAEAALHEVLDMMACKAAVKSGDRLAPEELRDLMSMRHLVERSSRCPHGRPTTLRLSLADLDRQFGRR